MDFILFINVYTVYSLNYFSWIHFTLTHCGGIMVENNSESGWHEM
jgi:hypothetical protein